MRYGGSPIIMLACRTGTRTPRSACEHYLLSLPGVFGTTLTTVPAAIPYLRANPVLVETWRQFLKPLAGFKIGIAWQGNPAAPGDKGRSIPLALFAPLGRIVGVRLFSLQKHDGIEQLANLPEGMTVLTLGDDFDHGPDAFLDTAAVMMNLDLVITSDTALVHLAGALARPVWMPLKQVPDWRWMADRQDTPWYPSARLFRQSTLDDWTPVLDRVYAELEAMAKARRAQVAV